MSGNNDKNDYKPDHVATFRVEVWNMKYHKDGKPISVCFRSRADGRSPKGDVALQAMHAWHEVLEKLQFASRTEFQKWQKDTDHVINCGTSKDGDAFFQITNWRKSDIT